MEGTRMPTMAQIAEMQERERKRSMSLSQPTPSNPFGMIQEGIGGQNDPLANTQQKVHDQHAAPLTYGDIVAAQESMTRYDNHSPYQEPTFDEIIDLLFEGYPETLEYLKSKMDENVREDKRLRHSLMRTIWKYREIENKTGNKIVDDINLKLKHIKD